MAERDENVYSGYNPTVRDYTEEPNVIVQGEKAPNEVDLKIEKRIEDASRGKLKARLASILDRGIVQDRLKVELPDNLHGEWVRNDPLEVRRLETLGFRVDEEFASKRAIHSDGSNSAIVGDVIFMTCPIEIKEVIDEIRHEQVIRAHTKKKVGKSNINQEEIDYIRSVEKEGDPKVMAYSTSDEREVTKSAIAEIIGDIDAQTKPFEKK